MEVIYSLIPGMLAIGLVALGILFWAARSGQYDDLDGDGQRILMDEDEDWHASQRQASAAPAQPGDDGRSAADGGGTPDDTGAAS